MALLWADGWDIKVADGAAGLWDNATVDVAAVLATAESSPWSRADHGVLSASGTGGRHGYLDYDLGSGETALYVGFKVKVNASTSYSDYVIGQETPIFAWDGSGGNRQLTLVYCYPSMTLAVYRGHEDTGTLLNRATTGPLRAGEWHYVEFRCFINNSTGIIQVRVDGVLTINQSGIDTDDGDGDIQACQLGLLMGAGGGEYPASISFDDFVILDTSGAYANSWPAGACIQRHDPDGEGFYTGDFTYQGGAEDYTNINTLKDFGELVDTSTTVMGNVTTNKQSVTLDDIDSAYIDSDAEVYGVLLYAYCQDISNNQSKLFSYETTTTDEVAFAAFNTFTSYEWRREIAADNDGSQWTQAEVDDLEFGMEVVT
jgi:hypothetical protein